MSKIVVMPDGNWLSHVSRPLEIAKVLRTRGYDVAFASDGRYMSLAKDCGFEVHSALTLDPEHILRCSRSGRVSWWNDDLVKATVEDDLRIFELLKPDLVLGDFRLSLSTSCEMAGIPLAVTLNAAWTNYFCGRVRAPEHLPLTRILGRTVTTWLLPFVKSWILRVDSAPFRRFRRRHNLPLRHNIWEIWRGDLNLLVDTPEYGPTTDLPSNFKYIGPIIWEPDLEPPLWLEKLDPDRPTLYFTMGSTGFARFFDQAIEIFGGSEYQCVMTTAGMVQYNDLPANFCVVDYAPGSEIMKRSDLVVCQGGNGTIYQALSNGTPIIGIPTMHDQEFNLDQVVALGAGIHLSELKFKAEHLRAAVREVLFNDSYLRAARKQQDVIRDFDGPQMGAKLIDEFILSLRKP